MSRANRRQFLQTVAVGATVSPLLLSSARAQSGGKRKVAAIGVGGSRGRYNRGGHVANNAAKFGDMAAVCDVDDRHTEEFSKKHGGKLNKYRDYRELLDKEKPDVVTIGTPDHWHVPIAIAALKAGCDVYCEKPLTLTIAEGIAVRKVVEETGRVFQVGTQQRSENDLRFLKAIALVQSGRLGSKVNAHVAIGGAPTEGPFAAEQAPSDLDWDRWVGPAPAADYSEKRRKMFRWFFEYSGGKMTDWGAHHIDIAQWALGQSHTGPVKISGTGKFTPLVPDKFDWQGFLNGEATLPSGFNTATEFHIDLSFANGSVLNVNHHFKRDDGTDFGNGILFEGENGRIFVNRGKLTGKPIDDLTEADHKELNDRIAKLYGGKEPGNHMRNFFECMDDRSTPVSDVSSHHRTMTSCHLCNIALMLGRDLKWDPKQETFIGDDQANALATRRQRQEYLG
ncbi:MAG: Gfo/Idh/MocA family oxidoreductase [Planctomycetales bacterium]|nr:Gfo/Idh/MocA family oxidoreductase [Planctomycetales bacterium]